MNFVAIDVETSNADMASICQIGIAQYESGILVDEWSSLINPNDYFSSINVGIHGISEGDVVDSPTLPEVAQTIGSYLNRTVCVCHTHFDRVSIGRALDKNNLGEYSCVWLDSAKVARRTWEDCRWSGYGLANLCNKIGYEFAHHNALEDAKAAGQVLLAALEISGRSIESWLDQIKRPIDSTKQPYRAAMTKEGNHDGELFGEVLVFTGSLEIPRREAVELAASMGCTVNSGVNKKTSLLVVGDQDISRLAGKDKSSKHRKAEQQISRGQNIRIIGESDFKELVHRA